MQDPVALSKDPPKLRLAGVLRRFLPIEPNLFDRE